LQAGSHVALENTRGKKNITDYKRAKLYENGLKKVRNELDIVKITRALRMSKVLLRTFKSK
jgi:hypothetical protein